ncbi:MAG: V-type ATP synthase subunit K [Candidatus Marinimicrobia bacterium]|nr:V-type ATP synthase subunit K [Candidatus Neomarinimicrobiota bacterium]
MNIGLIGPAAALGLSALGSALGTGVASQAAVGGWKKCFINNKPAPFLLAAFSGAPLTQTIYGFLLMLFLGTENLTVFHASIGVFGGLAMGLSAWMQGKAAARAADALAETGKGTALYFMVIGIVETVALFVMVFLLLLINSAK